MDTTYLLPETLFDYIALSVLGFAFLIQMFYFLFFYRRTGSNKTSPCTTECPPLSVVICARNEEQNLRDFLPLILNQDYPDFEVVVVSDCSQDDTEILLSQYKMEYPHLYYTSIPYDKIFAHGKKLPLTVGIKAAKNDILVFTDADCKPTDNQWLRMMAAGFSENIELVLAHGAYEKRPGLLNRLVRYDAFMIATQYFGYALAKVPYMGVGRNMAYRKSLFTKVGGFKSHQQILSGDDDLFISEAATKKNVYVVKNPSARTISVPVDKWSYFVHQKLRHLTTSPFYKFKVKFLLGLEIFSRELFYAGVIFSAIFPNFALVSLGLILVRTTTKLIVLGRAATKLGEGKVYLASLYLDFILPFLYFVFLIENRFRKKKSSWK